MASWHLHAPTTMDASALQASFVQQQHLEELLHKENHFVSQVQHALTLAERVLYYLKKYAIHE